MASHGQPERAPVSEKFSKKSPPLIGAALGRNWASLESQRVCVLWPEEKEEEEEEEQAIRLLGRRLW